MSYCVNCGVELEKSEKTCPLCGLEVQNPLQPYDENALRPYPRRMDPINARINRRFIATILSICFAFPAIFCMAINFFMDRQFDWSLYVTGGLVLVWIFVVPFFLFNKPTITLMALPDIMGILLYLLLIAQLQENSGWYLTLAMPMTLLFCGLVYFNGLMIEKQIFRGFVIPAVILISVGLLVAGIEWIVEKAVTGKFQLNWSFFVLIPSVALAAFFLTVARRQAIREEIKRRLHL